MQTILNGRKKKLAQDATLASIRHKLLSAMGEAAMPYLTIIKGPNQGTSAEITGDRFLVGRLLDNHFVLHANTVSKQHAAILKIQGKYLIEDVNSRSGTRLNGKRLHSQLPVKDGDLIQICDYMLAFSDQPREVEEDEDPSSHVVRALLDESSDEVLASQSAERLAMLLKIGAELTQTFDLGQLLPRVIDRLFAVFRHADRGFVIVRNDGKLVPKVSRTRRPDDAGTRFSRTIVNRVLENGHSVLIEDTSAASGITVSDSISEYRIRSVMCVPLIGRGSPKAFGAIQLDTQDRVQFTDDDLKLLLAVAGQAALAIDNADMHAVIVEREVERDGIVRDLKLAHATQQNFLPKKMPQVAAYEFAACYEAAQEVGGDYYDFIPLPGQRIGIMIGDVAGKGISAALLMARVSAEVRYCALAEPTLAGMVTRLNGQLQDIAALDRFVTFAAGVLDPATHEVAFANAGHVLPIVYRSANGGFEQGITTAQSGPPLGVAAGTSYESCAVVLGPGDCVVMMSDGIPDSQCKKDRYFRMKGVMAALRAGPMTARAAVDRLIAAVHHHATGRKPFDDLTMVAFGRVG
jgi:serine phosphatase RsbU (regulator of sigma subunit)/pSer/pThr/pTyr-binding forkhead associated (FHA) protein